MSRNECPFCGKIIDFDNCIGCNCQNNNTDVKNPTIYMILVDEYKNKQLFIDIDSYNDIIKTINEPINNYDIYINYPFKNNSTNTIQLVKKGNGSREYKFENVIVKRS